VGAVVLTVIIPASARSAGSDRAPRRCIPARGLVAYLEYDGLDAHAPAWQATAAHDLLLKTPAGPMVLDLVKQLIGVWLKEDSNDFGVLVTVPEVMTFAEAMVRRGFACAISQDDVVSHGMLILKDIGSAENLKRLAHVRGVFNASPSLLFAEVERRSVRGRTIYKLDDQISVWFEGDDMVLLLSLQLDVTGQAAIAPAGPAALPKAHERQVGNILDCVEGRQLGAIKHPAYLAARAEGRDLKGFEPCGLWFIDTMGHVGTVMLAGSVGIAADFVLPRHAAPSDTRTQDEANQAGPQRVESAAVTRRDIAPIRRIVGRWGFQDRALLSDIRVEATVAGAGRPVLRTDRLPLLPAGTRSFVMGAADLDRDYGAAARMLEAGGPDALGRLSEFEEQFREVTGLRLREDLLQPIGPTWCVYEIPFGAGDGHSKARAAPWDHVMVAQVKDPARAARAIDRLASSLDPADRFGDRSRDEPRRTSQQPARTPRFEPLPAPDRGYWLIMGPEAGEEPRPTLLVGPSAIVLARDLETARRVLSVDPPATGQWRPTQELARALDGLPRDLTFLAVNGNERSPVPVRLAGLPSAVQRLINLASEPHMDDASIWSVLDVLGVARPGVPRIRADRLQAPDPDRTRRTLLPSVVATAVDDRGLRIIGREPLPFLGVASELKVRLDWTVAWDGLVPRFREQLSLTLPRFDRKAAR
jgi:hypothetical protein